MLPYVKHVWGMNGKAFRRNLRCFSFILIYSVRGRKEVKKMSENRQKRKEVIEAELQKTRAELAIAKHREAKLHNQIKGMTEKERRHRNIVWGSHFEYLLREKLNVSKEQLATLDDDKVKDILNTLFSDLLFRRAMQIILAKKVKQQSQTE